MLNKNKIMLNKYKIFHVHTWRCGHAENISDEAYIKRAIELRAKEIFFTDHCPFPGDPFNNRMKYSQLNEYISTLSFLKIKYSDIISVKIGLEAEYIPSYHHFYEDLISMSGMDLLILGEHHAQLPDLSYTFEKFDKSEEWKYLMDGQIAGTETGFFSVVAHPDRLFKREQEWSADMEAASLNFLKSVKDSNTTLEKNIKSMNRKRQYWEEFWELVSPKQKIVLGCDAHFLKELRESYSGESING